MPDPSSARPAGLSDRRGRPRRLRRRLARRHAAQARVDPRRPRGGVRLARLGRRADRGGVRGDEARDRGLQRGRRHRQHRDQRLPRDADAVLGRRGGGPPARRGPGHPPRCRALGRRGVRRRARPARAALLVRRRRRPAVRGPSGCRPTGKSPGCGPPESATADAVRRGDNTRQSLATYCMFQARICEFDGLNPVYILQSIVGRAPGRGDVPGTAASGAERMTRARVSVVGAVVIGVGMAVATGLAERGQTPARDTPPRPPPHVPPSGRPRPPPPPRTRCRRRSRPASRASWSRPTAPPATANAPRPAACRSRASTPCGRTSRPRWSRR